MRFFNSDKWSHFVTIKVLFELSKLTSNCLTDTIRPTTEVSRIRTISTGHFETLEIPGEIICLDMAGVL